MQDTPLIGPIKQFQQVDIVGSGIAGLVLGFYLKQAKIPFTLYEKSEHIGGKIKTTKRSYGIAESAANAIFANQAIINLLRQLNLDWIKADPKLKRLIWTSHGVINSPLNFRIIFKTLSGVFKKVPTEKKREEMSVAEFFTPWLGRDFVDEVISTGLQGIYADKADNILFSALWPEFKQGHRYYQFILHLFRMRRLSQTYGSISFKHGMGEFVEKLKSELQNNIQSSHTVTQINPKNLTIICTDANDAGDILGKNHPTLAKLLFAIEYNGVNTTTFFLKNKIEKLNGAFGVLFSAQAQEKFQTYGVLNNSEIFTFRSSPNFHSYTIINSSQIELKDIKNDLLKIGAHLPIEDMQTIQWSRAIPCYNLNRKKQMELIFDQLPPNVGLFASYTNGVSIRHMINFAPKIIAKITGYYQAGQ
jgi:oxygen-dependent protoporphyrinogen oxidase